MKEPSPTLGKKDCVTIIYSRSCYNVHRMDSAENEGDNAVGRRVESWRHSA